MNAKITALISAGIILTFVGCPGKHESIAKQKSQSDSTIAGNSSASTAGFNGDTLSYVQRQGKFLYNKYCMVCHGAEGKGDGFNAFNLDPKPGDFTDSKQMNALTDDRIIQTISGGGRSVNRSALMPMWGGRMQKEEVTYVLSYIRTFASSK